MTLTANLEKVLMHYIFQNPLYFKTVQPHYFKNQDVQFVYKTTRDSYLGSNDREVPSLVEVFELVKLADKTGDMSPELVKSVLRVDLTQFRKEQLDKFYQSLVLTNAMKDGLTESIEKLREIDVNNLDSIKAAAAMIKEIVQASTTVVVDDGGLGVNFDDAEAHNQDAYANKVPCGWKTMDRLMGGGWDRKTFNVIMGETNVGKCYVSNTLVTLKNKLTNQVYKVEIGELYTHGKDTLRA